MVNSAKARLSKVRGYATEHFCRGAASYEGYSLEFPESHKKHDVRLCNEETGETQKCQIKTGRLTKSGKVSFPITSNKARTDPASKRIIHEKIRYQAKDVDAFLVWVKKVGSFHLVPFAIANQAKGSSFLMNREDYTFGSIICIPKNPNIREDKLPLAKQNKVEDSIEQFQN